MKKKTIIIISIISIISAIFSVVYLLLNYFGLIRYINIYLYSTESYQKNYKNLDKIGKYKTIISLTTTPKQMSKLSHVIKSLLDQTVRVDLISINVPNGDQYNLPIDLVKSVLLSRCDEDKGLLNCLLPSILKEIESTTRIISLGAGTIYGKDFIETLMDESEKHQDKIIYSNTNDNIDLTKGVVFYTNFFNIDFLDIPHKTDGNKLINDYFRNFPKKRINYSENYKSL